MRRRSGCVTPSPSCAGTIHEVVVEDDLAVVHCTMSGRHVRPVRRVRRRGSRQGGVPAHRQALRHHPDALAARRRRPGDRALGQPGRPRHRLPARLGPSDARCTCCVRRWPNDAPRARPMRAKPSPARKSDRVDRAIAATSAGAQDQDGDRWYSRSRPASPTCRLAALATRRRRRRRHVGVPDATQPVGLVRPRRGAAQSPVTWRLATVPDACSGARRRESAASSACRQAVWAGFAPGRRSASGRGAQVVRLRQSVGGPARALEPTQRDWSSRNSVDRHLRHGRPAGGESRGSRC